MPGQSTISTERPSTGWRRSWCGRAWASPGYRERAVTDIIDSLLPLARQGLDAIGVAAAESGRYLGVIERRLQRRQTGAIWQRGMLAQLQGKMPLPDALHELLETYHESQRGKPARWRSGRL